MSVIDKTPATIIALFNDGKRAEARKLARLVLSSVWVPLIDECDLCTLTDIAESED